MNHNEIIQFIRLVNYFNKEYTSNFITFVENNKDDIDIFKTINYN